MPNETFVFSELKASKTLAAVLQSMLSLCCREGDLRGILDFSLYDSIIKDVYGMSLLQKATEYVSDTADEIFNLLKSEEYYMSQLRNWAVTSLTTIRYHHIENYQTLTKNLEPMVAALEQNGIKIGATWNLKNLSEQDLFEISLVALLFSGLFIIMQRFVYDALNLYYKDADPSIVRTHLHTRDDALGENAKNWKYYLARLGMLNRSYLIMPDDHPLLITSGVDDICNACTLQIIPGVKTTGNHCASDPKNHSVDPDRLGVSKLLSTNPQLPSSVDDLTIQLPKRAIELVNV